MANSETLSVITHILYDSCDVNSSLAIDFGTRLSEDLGLDSMGLLTLTVELENHYQKVLTVNVAEPPRTVGELVDLIECFKREAQNGYIS